jgi:CDP-archaeol synthase
VTTALDPAACAAFLIGAFTLAGCFQTFWLASPLSRRFARPLDGGRTFRGRPLFGTNKNIRGFMVMVPAAGVAFALVAAAFMALGPQSAGLWPGSASRYMLLGIWAGFGFMLGELPNSFLKRQLDIAPGRRAAGAFAGPAFLVLDHLDSIVGMLVALALAIPLPWQTCVYVLLFGPLLHASFSLVLFRLGGKVRAA